MPMGAITGTIRVADRLLAAMARRLSGHRRPEARLTCYAAESASAFRQRTVMRRPRA
jgi:hypothetical protein